MPQPITHYHVIESTFQRTPELKRLWDMYSNYAVFGSIFPDLFYFSSVPKKMGWEDKRYPHDYYKASDVMHLEGFLDLYFSMLDFIKATPNGDKKDKLKAFAYGALSHYITDANVHPFVYAKTGDNQFTHDPPGLFDAHKSLESLMDRDNLGHRGVTYFDFDYYKKFECHEQGSGRTLDKDIFELIAASMNKTYGNRQSYGDGIFGRHGINYDWMFRSMEEKPEHPVLESYRDAVTVYRNLSNHPRLVKLARYAPFLPRRFKVLLPETRIESTDLHKFAPIPSEPWIKDPKYDELHVPRFSVPQLIEMSLMDTMTAMYESERFLDSSYASASEYFSRNPSITPLLRFGINMDTGDFESNNGTIRSKNTPAERLIMSLGNLNERYGQHNIILPSAF
ncbi:zinc dependent phospholipase C family protein [Candidatus Woesearchaeota archaeon]|nr:zinc dependent phospholipase C family protein [Candidatus Woesearchaeota archaeon]